MCGPCVQSHWSWAGQRACPVCLLAWKRSPMIVALGSSLKICCAFSQQEAPIHLHISVFVLSWLDLLNCSHYVHHTGSQTLFVERCQTTVSCFNHIFQNQLEIITRGKVLYIQDRWMKKINLFFISYVIQNFPFSLYSLCVSSGLTLPTHWFWAPW